MDTYKCENCDRVIKISADAVPVECPECLAGDMLPYETNPILGLLQPYDGHHIEDIDSGLGIGGYGSEDFNIWTEHRPEPRRPKSQAREQSCHYCGCPATAFGFFDEPICPECGG